MESNKILAIISIIIGLIFIIFPIFSANLISILIGAAVLIFGIGLAYTGIISKDISPAISTVSAIFGIVMIILGLAFIFGTNAISFLVGLQFYIVGFIMIVFGLTGLFSKMSRVPAFSSILILVMGIVLIALGTFSLNQPIFIAIIIGVVLIIEGVLELMSA